ncbi:uncharacterized protein LOC115228118 [Argonauta hians]
MSKACELAPAMGSAVQMKPDSVISQMLYTVQDGKPEDKHCLSFECDVILECKVCRNLFRAMQSFLNHKKDNCLEYLIKFDVPVPTKEKEVDKNSNESSNSSAKEKSEIVSPKEQSPDKTTSKTVSKSKAKAESSGANQVKSPPESPKEVKPIENNDSMKLRNSRKKDTPQKDNLIKDAASQKRDNSHKKDTSPQKKDSPNDKRDSSSTKRHSRSDSKDSSLEKRNSSHRRDSSPKRRESSSHRREGSDRRESSTHRRDSSSEKKEIAHKKDASPEKRESSQSRRERRESASSKQEKQSSLSEKDISHKKETEKRGSLTPKKDTLEKKRHAPPRKVNTSNLKEDPKKKDVSNKEHEEMEVTIETRSSAAKQRENSHEEKMEIDDKNETSTNKQNATMEKKVIAGKENDVASAKDTEIDTNQKIGEGQVKEAISDNKVDTTLQKENKAVENADSRQKSTPVTRKRDSVPDKNVTTNETKASGFHEKPFPIKKQVVIVEKKNITTEIKETSSQDKVIEAEKNDITGKKKDMATETRSILKKDSSIQKKDMSTETKSVDKKDSTVQKKDMATETSSVEKKDSTVQKKDMATDTKSVEKKVVTVQKKDMATETKSVEKKDSTVQKKDMSTETKSVEKKDSTVQKKDMSTETKSVDKKDSTVQKKDMSTETKSIEKKDSTVQKKDMATETKSVEKKVGTVQKKDMATETKSVEKKVGTVQKKDMSTETKSVEKKDSTVQKKDMSTETKSVEKKDGTVQKKDMSTETKSVEKKDSTVQKKDMSTETKSVERKDGTVQKKDMATETKSVERKVTAVNTVSTATDMGITVEKDHAGTDDGDKKTKSDQDSNSKKQNGAKTLSVPNTSELKVVNEENKNDASDKLNPLIAGVLDAYQRFKEDKTQSQPKESETASKTNAEIAIPDVNDKKDHSENGGKELSATEKEASAADKSKPGELDLDNKDLNDPERYELRNKLRCPDCDLELTNMTKLANHMSKHLAESKGHFVCPICQKETRLESFSDLIFHLRDPHFLKDKQLLPMWRNLMKNCWVDEQDVSASFPVIEAVKRSERSNEDAVPEKNYKCPYCKRKPKILRYFSGLIGHLRSAHGLKRHQIQKIQTKLRKTSVVEVVHKKEIKTSRRMLYKCSFCSKTFRKKSTIKLHVKSCKKRPTVTVKEAKNKKPRARSKTFTKIVSYKSKKDPSRPEHTDAVASTTAAGNSEGLVEPKRVPLMNQPLHSSYLDPQNTSNREADRHIDVNLIQPVKLETFWVSKTPGKPSKCVKSTVTNLEKLCQTPSKIFKSELTKIGNFQCYSCKRYYSVRQHFERHVQLCTQNRKIEEISDFQGLRCLECNQTFSYLQHLKRHAAKHLGLDRFRCKLCNYSSYYWSDTKCHLTTHKDIDYRSPEYYIVSVSSSEYSSPEMSNSYTPQVKRPDHSQTSLKRHHESSQPSSGSGVVKTLVLTEQDGMLKVVSDPNQIAKMVGQQGSPPLKRLRIATDVTQSPAIMKALPEIQKAMMTPSPEKRESTLLTKTLPSPTLSDPTPSTEQFEPATDPDKQHQSWVRKPLKDPDAQPFTWDDDEEEENVAESNLVKAIDKSSISDNKVDTNKLLSTESSKKSQGTNNTATVEETLKAVSAIAVLEDKQTPDEFPEPPKLKKEIHMDAVRCPVRDIKMEDNLQMPSISGPEIAVNSSQGVSETVMTVMLNENNDMIFVSPNPNNNNTPVQGSTTHKEFFRVSHPVLTTSQSPSSHSSYISTLHSTPGLSKSSPKAVNKPKTMWDMQHKNALRRLPTRGLVSTSTLAFPSASRRINRMTEENTSSTPAPATTYVTVTTESNSTAVNTSTSPQPQSVPTTK